MRGAIVAAVALLMLSSAAAQLDQPTSETERQRLEAQFERMRSDIEAELEHQGLSSTDAKGVAEKTRKDLLDCVLASDRESADSGFVIVRVNGSTYIVQRRACLFEILANAGIAAD